MLSLAALYMHHALTQSNGSQVFNVQSELTATNPQAGDFSEISALLDQPPLSPQNGDFTNEQRKNLELMEIITYLEHGELPCRQSKSPTDCLLETNLYNP